MLGRGQPHDKLKSFVLIFFVSYSIFFHVFQITIYRKDERAIVSPNVQCKSLIEDNECKVNFFRSSMYNLPHKQEVLYGVIIME